MPTRPPLPTSPVQAYLEALIEQLRPLQDGAVADYIPALAAADPEQFGVALVTVDGAVYAAGDHGEPFTIQSISKPFTYGLALADRGFAEVDAHVGVEPSGDAFNSISLESDTGRPRNPMINAGAITATSLVAGDRDARILELYSRCAGRPLSVDEPTFSGERETGHRNRAIGHMLRAVGMLDEDPEAILDAYFRQCAIAVDCVDVARMAATLAGGGMHPGTGEQILEPAHVRRMLSVMSTCGMYDGAGDWMVRVGLPAKSGVAGGVMAVLPGQLGLCAYSPRLDGFGNSVRGVAACLQISEDLSLHAFEAARAGHATVRARFDLAAMPSTRRWPAAERARLEQVGARCAIYELQGDLVFGAVERVIRDAVEASSDLDVVILDLTRSGPLDTPALRRFGALATMLARHDRTLALATSSALESLADARTFHTLDDALEWAEWTLLELDPQAVLPPVVPADHPLLADLSAAQLAEVLALGALRPIAAGDVLARAGEPVPGLSLLLAGEVVLRAEGAQIATLMPGATIGQRALSDDRRRLVDVIATRDGEVLELGTAAIDAIAAREPALHAELLRALLDDAQGQLLRLTRQAAAHD